MTIKEQTMKNLLEDAFRLAIVNATAMAEPRTAFDVAEYYAGQAVDFNPTVTDPEDMAELAIRAMVANY